MKKKRKSPIGLVAVLVVLVGGTVFFQLVQMGVFRRTAADAATLPPQGQAAPNPTDEKDQMAASLKSGASTPSPGSRRPELPGMGGAAANPAEPTVATAPRRSPAAKPAPPKPNDSAIAGQWWDERTHKGSR